MEVKPGYKQTEVGVIPEEWDVKTLGDVGSTYGGLTGKTKADFGEGPARYITFMNVMSNVVIDCGTFEQVQVSPTESQNRAKKGDLFLNGSSESPEEVAMCSVLLDEVRDVYLNSFCFGFRFHDGADADGLFLAHYLRSKEGRELMKSLAQGSTRYNLSKVALLKSPLRLPKLSEQTAIATALSDVDGLLGGLGRLIAKKRDLKQAAMQQLLTGQTRLPGFHGEWEVKRLGDAFTISAGKSKSAYVVDDGDFWVCDMGSVSIEGRLIVSKRTNYRGDFLKRGDLIMPKDDIGGGNIIGKVGYIDANDTYILGDHVYCLRALEGDPRYLAYVINSHRVNSELRKKVIGSAQLGLGRKSVNEQEIQFPPHAEQTAIAEVLTEMDEDLAGLTLRRGKTRALKQAMMYELLTGRTRLI